MRVLPPGRRQRIWSLRERSPLVQSGLAVVFAGIALLTCEFFRTLFAPSFESPFIAAVALAAWFGGFYCGLASALLSAAAVVYFYTEPYNSFFIDSARGWTHLAAFTATNLLITFLIRSLYRSQTVVRDTEENLRSSTDLIPFGGWRADANGNLIEISEVFLTAFGTSTTRCAGLGWLDLVVDEERDRVRSAWVDCMTNCDFWDYEFHMKAPNGPIYAVLSRGVPVSSGRRKIWIGIHLDVTDREKASERRLEHERDIARFNAELEQFAYVAAHDLQEPLRMVASYVQLLARRYGHLLDDDARTFIAYSVEGATRLQALLHGLQLLPVIGSQPQRRQLHPLAKAANRAKENLATRIKQSASTITFDDLPTVRCDMFEMTQLFEHLFDNSLKFRAENTPAHIHVSASKEGHFWHIVVADDGIGIDPAYLKRIFDLFQRLNPRDKFPGTGIGLTICKKIVEVHGGNIWGESLPKGAAIHITLPV